jgi:hypothetical protein
MTNECRNPNVESSILYRVEAAFAIVRAGQNGDSRMDLDSSVPILLSIRVTLLPVGPSGTDAHQDVCDYWLERK